MFEFFLGFLKKGPAHKSQRKSQILGLPQKSQEEFGISQKSQTDFTQVEGLLVGVPVVANPGARSPE